MTTRIDYSASRLDQKRADRVRRIFEEILVHTKGVYARKRFLLADWQWSEIIRPLFGTVVFDPEIDEWVRRYRVAWLELARKNGKSELLAGIALVLLDGDDEEGAEVYGAAKDRDQAALVFRVAARMVELSPTLSRRLRVYRTEKRIVNVHTDSFYKVIAADAEGNLGPDPHGIIFDEVIAQPDRGLWDALKTGMGSASRRQPLMVAATTAGNDPTSFAATEHEYCEKVARDPSLDPARFVYMRNTPKTRRDPKTKKVVAVDWRDEREWRHANPALGDFLRIQILREEALEAEQNPATENRFRQFRLNQWVQQAERWISLTVWDEAGMELISELERRLEGRECWAGLDLASTQDTVALVLDFPLEPPQHAGLFRFWVPEDRIPNLDERTGGQAAVWVKEGFLKTTPGNVIDHDAIWEQIRADANRFRIWELGFDAWNKGNIESEFESAPFELVEIRQTFLELSGATKEWEKLILRKRYHHAGHPVMRWQVDNIVVESDNNENVKISKAKKRGSKDKVDGPAASVMALKLALLGRRGGQDRTLRVS
jgi:phage terminase large subunit-like protein